VFPSEKNQIENSGKEGENMRVKINLGGAEINGIRIFPSSLVVVASGTVVRRNNKPKTVPVGGVILPCRDSVPKIFDDGYSAMSGLRGVVGYSGGVGRGKFGSAAEMAERYASEADKCSDARGALRLRALAQLFASRLYVTGRLISWADVCRGSLFLELNEHKRVLNALAGLLTAFIGGKQIDRSRIRELSNAIRLAPFFDLRDEFAKFWARTGAEAWESDDLVEKREEARELVGEIKSHLRRIAFEEIIFELKELERTLFDARNRLDLRPAEADWFIWLTSQAVAKMDIFLAMKHERDAAESGRLQAIRANLAGIGRYVSISCRSLAFSLLKSTRREMKRQSEFV
jgi:hypothetical protein